MPILLVFLILFSSSVMAEDSLVAQPDKGDENLIWHKWETENFIVLSLDRGFGSALKSSLEGQRKGVCELIGAGTEDFPVKCKIVCVPDAKTLGRFFSVDEPCFEVKRDGSGGVTEMSIWMDQERSRILRGLIASACLHDKSRFLRVGIPLLMAGPEETSDAVISASIPDEWRAGNLLESDLSPELSAALCLFVRREFGSALFSKAMNGDSRLDSLCGFRDVEELEESFFRYVSNLKGDLESGKTPRRYLEAFTK